MPSESKDLGHFWHTLIFVSFVDFLKIVSPRLGAKFWQDVVEVVPEEVSGDTSTQGSKT